MRLIASNDCKNSIHAGMIMNACMPKFTKFKTTAYCASFSAHAVTAAEVRAAYLLAGPIALATGIADCFE